MKKQFLIFLFFLFIDLIFFWRLIFLNQFITTPEFGGGDILTVLLPYKKIACEAVKNNTIPFWSSALGYGYPVFAEGEIGFFNPINITTCFLFDYKTAFNYSMILHIFLCQIFLFLFLRELNVSLLSNIIGAVFFPFLPIMILNYIHLSLLMPIFYMPLVFYSVYSFIEKQNKKYFLIVVVSVFLQFISCHFQTFFISSLLIYLFSFLFIFKNEKINKKIRLLFLIALAYVLGLFLASFQLIPTIKFFLNSDRNISISDISYALKFDQNMKLENLLTFTNPYFFGIPKDGSFDFKNIHPWESNFSLYVTSFITFIILFFRKKIKLDKLMKIFLILGFIFLLLAFGSNSPIYFVHNLPLFSSIRFPSRFIFGVTFSFWVFFILVLDIFFKKNKYKKIIFIFIFCALFIESAIFFYKFNVFEKKDKLFTSSLFKSVDSVFITPNINKILDKKYMESGYKDNFYKNYIENLGIGNANVINGFRSISNKSGPQLKRNIYFSSYLNFDIGDNNELTFPNRTINTLILAKINKIISFKKISNNQLVLDKKINFQSTNLYIYKFLPEFVSPVIYDNPEYLQSLYSFDNYLNSTYSAKLLIEKKINLNNNSQKKLVSDIQTIQENDQNKIYKISTNKSSVFYIPEIWYPNWEIYIDGKKAEIIRANFLFMGIVVPEGKHIIQFQYNIDDFYLGLSISAGIFLILIIYYILLRGISSSFFKRK